MTDSTQAKIPEHLRRYIVDQNYSRYTPEDQAVWRYIMRQLKNFLSKHAHASYLSGFAKTGLNTEKIPNIEEIDRHLERFGWGAVPVSGFIPPAAFMEFQSIGVLPIASDMRTLDHLLYTPAPDIVHEAAGHAPFLADPEYAAYLRQYGEVARHAIISREDLEQYEAIRVLSDMKEDPASTKRQIAEAESRLDQINRGLKNVSEAGLLSRMNWWTAEYGLVGDLKNPKIFGAGLLSSVGESRDCLSERVAKIPLTVDCVNFSYDITEPQPQLFVTESFAHLGDVLEDLARRMAYRRGGEFALERAVEAATVNTVELNSKLQISAVLKNFKSDGANPFYLQFSGPTQISLAGRELPGQGVQRHSQGFSTPLGLLKNHSRCLSTFTAKDLANLALKVGARTRLEFESGVKVEGVISDFTFHEGKLLLITWRDVRVTFIEELLFDPSWGEFDMAVGCDVRSVYGGPADRSKYGQTDEFVAKKIPPKTFSDQQSRRHAFYRKTGALRSGELSAGEFDLLLKNYLQDSGAPWLQGVELLELTYHLEVPDRAAARAALLERLGAEGAASPNIRSCIQDGIELAAKNP